MKWLDVDKVLKQNLKEEIDKDNSEDELYLLMNKAKEND